MASNPGDEVRLDRVFDRVGFGFAEIAARLKTVGFGRKVANGLFAGGLIAAAVVGIALGGLELWPAKKPRQTVDVTPYLGRSPHVLTTAPLPVSLPISHEQLRTLALKVASSAATQHESPSAMLHATRLSDLVGPEVRSWMRRDHAGRIDQLNLNADMFQDSWRGIETRRTTEGDRSEHRDQLLSALAQFGVPLPCVVRKAEDQEQFSVRDLLRTSLSEFHLNQAEMSWTATAYALYLPPQLYWHNRYGERFDFDDLTIALVSKRLHSESCCGLHLMLALTTILRVDRDSTILREETRGRLDQYLSQRVQEAVESQLPDGSWPVMWANSGDDGQSPPLATPPATFSRRLTISGHLLEWFQLLPPDRQPPETTIKNGLLWLVPQLLSMNDSHFPTEICPCTHALLAVEGSLRRNSDRAAGASQ